MKSTISLFMTLAVFLFSCSTKEVTPQPTVSFTAKLNGNGNVSFFASSSNADSFTWDFGDGGNSTDKNPTYTYTKNGRFNVTLTAKGKGGQVVDVRSIDVTDILGGAMFWMQNMRNKNIEVTLAGYTAIISGYYSGGAPSCGAQMCATFGGFKEGVYSFEAREIGSFTPSVWKGQVKITGNGCVKQQLTY